MESLFIQLSDYVEMSFFIDPCDWFVVQGQIWNCAGLEKLKN